MSKDLIKVPAAQDMITIGITCFNASDTIARAVDSALKQEWDNLEILIVDDCSTDNSAALIEKKFKGNSKVRLIKHKKNLGVAAARQTIIDNAKGDFIAFFDDDDQSKPTRIKTQHQRIIDYEKNFAQGFPVICHSAREQIYPQGSIRYEPTMGTKEDIIAPNGKAVARRILTGKPQANIFGSIATCSQMARTKSYIETGGFDKNFRRMEDTDFNIRFALAGGHFAGVAEPLVTQLMTKADDKKLTSERYYALKLLDKYKDFINQKSSYNFCKGWVDAKYDFISGQKLLFLAKLTKLFLTHPIETLKRIYWSLPNLGFNVKSSKFYRE